MIIGITGGTGCGKTTALKVINQLGGTVIDCDAVYHRLLDTDPALTAAIEARFPGTVVQGKLDRKKLGGLVFSDPQALSDLNAITHAAVKKEVLRLVAQGSSPIAIDAIGLFESGLADLCHITVAITAPEEARVARLMAREGISRDYALNRIRAQHSQDWFTERCTYTLENDGSIDAFATKCLAFFQGLDIMKPEDTTV